MGSAAELGILMKARDEASHIMQNVAKVGLAMGAALAAGAVMALKAAADEEKGIARLDQALKNTGRSLGGYSNGWKTLGDEIEENVREMERWTAFSDGELRDALATLVTATGSYEEGMKRSSVAVDLARGANIDLQTAAKLLGKVTDENVTVLKRYGITLKDGADATDVLEAVTKRFGGQAAAYAKTAAGQWQIFTNQVDNLKEDIGGALLPVFVAFTSKATEAVDALRQGPIPGLVAALVGKAGSVKAAALEMFGVITGRAPDAGVALKELAGEEGAQKVMNVLAHIREYVRDELVPGFEGLRDRVREIVDEVLLPKWTSVQNVLHRITGGTLDLTTAFSGLAVVMVGLHVVEWTESVVLAAKAVWAWTEAVRAGEIAAMGLKLQLALFIAVGVLVVEAFLQVKETIELVMANWDTFTYALRTGQLNDIPVFGFFFNIAQKVIGFLETIKALWNTVAGAFSGAQAPGPAPQINENMVVPGFASGGIVPGPIGAPQLAVVHGGETITPTGGGGGGITVNINGPVYGMADFNSQVTKAVREAVQRGGLRGVMTTS